MNDRGGFCGGGAGVEGPSGPARGRLRGGPRWPRNRSRNRRYFPPNPPSWREEAPSGRAHGRQNPSTGPKLGRTGHRHVPRRRAKRGWPTGRTRHFAVAAAAGGCSKLTAPSFDRRSVPACLVILQKNTSQQQQIFICVVCLSSLFLLCHNPPTFAKSGLSKRSRVCPKYFPQR